jgi:hypothetical protein
MLTPSPLRLLRPRIALPALLVLALAGGHAAEYQSLAGEWRFALPGPEPSFPQAPTGAALPGSETIALPGTTDTRGKGPESTWRDAGSLTRVRSVVGAAWYERNFEVPAAWAGRRIQLRIERTRYTQVWVDGRAAGEQGMYTAEQRYDLTAFATPGPHRLTVMVDNRADRRPIRGQAHQFDDGTQANWNGLLGAIELVATPATWLDDVQVYPDLAAQALRVRVSFGQLKPGAIPGKLRLSAESFNHEGAADRPAPLASDLEIGAASRPVELVLPLGQKAKPWSEYSPALYRLNVVLETAQGRDERVVETGLREFRAQGTQLTINGRPTYLRGKHEAGAFPLTGHPPMSVEEWERYLRIVRDWGFNHVRCHTWVPPEAAFAAADRLGLYLQPELPFWGTFDGRVRDFLLPQAEAVLRAYGNHPSFVMMTLANEAGGDRGVMNAMVSHLRALDPRHLYADGSNNVLWDPAFQPSNDFMVSAKLKPPAAPDRARPARGSFCVFDGDEGHTQWGPAETRTDLSAALAGLPVPFLGHETGQWTMYPDFAQIAKYTGVFRAYNLERFQASLTKHGMADQAGEFARASGALAAELYREENELFRRSRGTAGYQHLDLQDYPGQGSALVGLLDVFMDSKGLVTPEEFRRSNGAIVVLARFDRYTWTTADTLVADLQLSHYGPADLRGARTSWALHDAKGMAVAQGALPVVDLAQGRIHDLGRVAQTLRDLPAPARYDLDVEVTAGAGRIAQHWPVWVYPATIDTAVPGNVTLVRAFDAATKRLLADGRRVVLIPGAANWANTLPGGYATDYWNWPMFNGTPGTLGLLVRDQHPALAGFPTRGHSERQWSALAHAATPVLLFATPPAYRPTVQVIDNYERNEKLGLIFEARVGPGRLLVCAVDLLGEELRDRPEAKQLLASLLRYAAADAFAPGSALEPATLDLLLRPSLAGGAAATASSSFTPPWGFVPQPRHACDGDLNTKWFPAEGDKSPWLAVDLGATRTIDVVEIVWEHDTPGYRGTLETSADGHTWTKLPAPPDPRSTDGRTLLRVARAGVRHLRLKIEAWPTGGRPAVRELRVLGAESPLPSAPERIHQHP